MNSRPSGAKAMPVANGSPLAMVSSMKPEGVKVSVACAGRKPQIVSSKAASKAGRTPRRYAERCSTGATGFGMVGERCLHFVFPHGPRWPWTGQANARELRVASVMTTARPQGGPGTRSRVHRPAVPSPETT